MSRRGRIGSVLLLTTVVGTGGALAAWKYASKQEARAASANQPEPIESVTVAVAKALEHRQTTTSIGTVIALRSITLRNELPGTVRQVMLTPGQIVDTGTVLVGLDISVEEAELKAQEAQAALAETTLERMQRARQNRAVSEIEVDRARAERDVALAQIARAKAIIARKTIRAMVRARIEGAANAPAPGASVRVRVPVGAPRLAVAVPVSALRKGPGGDHVFVIAPDKDGKTRARVRPVKSGAMLGDEIVILAGLSAGEQVAASGSFKLRDAVRVAIPSDPGASGAR